MTVVATLSFGRPLTRDDLQHLPDSHRYELIDGSLIVSTGPRHPHQVILGAFCTGWAWRIADVGAGS